MVATGSSRISRITYKRDVKVVQTLAITLALFSFPDARAAQWIILRPKRMIVVREGIIL